jgi:hypothetical protein
MIRPVTIATFLMACGSGLYLYQTKHDAQVVDRNIERTIHETSAVREQSRELLTQWAIARDPVRLRQFADRYLTLKTIDPTQYTSLADLDNRLPPVQTSQPATIPVAEQPTTGLDDAAEPPHGTESGRLASADDEADTLPVPPMPAARKAPVAHVQTAASASSATTAMVATARPAERMAVPPRVTVAENVPPRPTPMPETRVPETRAPEGRASEARAVEARPAARFALPVATHTVAVAPIPAVALQPQRSGVAPKVVAAQPRPVATKVEAPTQRAERSMPAVAARGEGGYQGGSLLGMAHSVPPPAPMPTRISATYNAN